MVSSRKVSEIIHGTREMKNKLRLDSNFTVHSSKRMYSATDNVTPQIEDYILALNRKRRKQKEFNVRRHRGPSLA
jgi:F0F1-type ATP synthase gamma subunit